MRNVSKKPYEFLLLLLFFIFSYKSVISSEINTETLILGSSKAKISVKEYFSLTCTHCKNFHIETFPDVKKKLIDTGKISFEFVDYPLNRIAMYATSITRSIPKESYLDAVEILLKNQDKWAFSKEPLEELFKISKTFGVTKEMFEKSIKNYELMEKILKKMESESKKHDINSTPTFIINDKFKITGTLNYLDFEKKINEIQLSEKNIILDKKSEVIKSTSWWNPLDWFK